MASDTLLDGPLEKISKAAAGYLDACPGQRRPCVVCPSFDPHMRSCAKVEGTVAAMATCDQFTVVAASRPVEADDANDRKVPLWGSKDW